MINYTKITIKKECYNTNFIKFIISRDKKKKKLKIFKEYEKNCFYAYFQIFGT